MDVLHSISKAFPLQAEWANTSLARLVPGTKRQKASFQVCFEASGSFILQHVTNNKRLHTPHLLEGVKHLRIKVLTRSDKRDPQFWWHGHGPKCFQDCYLHNCHWKYSVECIGTSDCTAAQQHNKGSRQRNQRQPLGKPRWSVAPGSRTLLQSCLWGRGINLSWDLGFPNHLRLSPYLASASSANMVKAGKAADAAWEGINRTRTHQIETAGDPNHCRVEVNARLHLTRSTFGVCYIHHYTSLKVQHAHWFT